MADYKSLENKIRDIVGRPWTKDPKQVHHKQQQIQKKIIDEEPDMLNNKALGIPDSVVEAAKNIGKKTEVVINPDYKPRMDQEEELVGKQHKIDVNKNGKIDADDFKKLRSKTLKEGPPTSSDPDFAAPRAPGSPSNPNEIKYKPEPKKPEQKKPEPKPVPVPPKRPSNLNTEAYSGTPSQKRVVFTGSPRHTSKKAEEYKKQGYEVERIKKGPSGIFGDNSEKHTYSMVHKSVKEEAKPDYLDFDKDGNKKESMKKALSDKKKVTKEEVVFSDEELAKLEAISKDVNEAPALAGIVGAARSAISNVGKQIFNRPNSLNDLVQRQKDMLNKHVPDSMKNVKNRATNLLDKLKSDKAKNNALLGLQGVHDVTALATGKDPYSQAMKEPQAPEPPEATDQTKSTAAPTAAPTEKKKVAKEETLFSDEELANLQNIAEKEQIDELAPLALAAPLAVAAGRAAAPYIARGLAGAARAKPLPKPSPAPRPVEPAPAPAPKPAEPMTPPKPANDPYPLPGSPVKTPPAQPPKPANDPLPSPKPAPTTPKTPEPAPTTPKTPEPAPSTPKPTPKPTEPAPKPAETPAPAPGKPAPKPTKPGPKVRPGQPKKPAKKPEPKPQEKPWYDPLRRLPDTSPQPQPEPDTETQPRTQTEPQPQAEPQPRTQPEPQPKVEPKPETQTQPRTRVPPVVIPPGMIPPPLPVAAPKPSGTCSTCGPNTYVRTHGRVEPRVGRPSPLQVQNNSYEPEGEEIREANLAAQIRDAKPSLTGHIEVSLGDKKVKIPHRKAQDFLGSYHSKRTPAEKDAHEKAFRREIGG